MRFFSAGVTGLGLAALTAGLVAVGVLQFLSAQQARDTGPRSAPRERVFAVATAPVALQDIAPRIDSFGRVRAGRSLALSSRAAGRVIEVAPALREGGLIAAGAVMLRVDPEDYRIRRDTAAIALEEAQADAAEARQSVRAADQERAAATLQRDLRAAALDRQRGLAARGVSAQAGVDEAEFALRTAEQAVASREQALLAAELRIPRADLAVRRAALALEEAERMLADTEIRAPFAGVLAGTLPETGDLLSAGQAIGTLIDPSALEVGFHLTGAQAARLAAADGRLPPLPVAIGTDGGVTLDATLDRMGPILADGRSGREVYARLDTAAPLLRPGDFVTVTLHEPPLRGVARLPATAVSETGGILLVDADERLVQASVRILRREGDDVIAADVPAGGRLVLARRPELAPGLRVREAGGRDSAPGTSGRRAPPETGPTAGAPRG